MEWEIRRLALFGSYLYWIPPGAPDLSRMKAVLEVNEEDMDCLIEPGVTRQELNAFLRDKGLFFPVDPGSHASIGGMCATRASGTNAVRYGTIRENVLGLEVVLADGRVIETGTLAANSSSGYHLPQIFVGSEGTLGVFTRITLSLVPLPPEVLTALAAFPDAASATRSVTGIMASGRKP